MDLARAPDPEKLRLCRLYFRGGFALLPFMWLVNALWFFSDAFRRKPAFAEQRALRRLVTLSALGFFTWTVLLIAWIVVFQTQRVKWGAVGDRMSFVWPRGYA